MFLIQAAGGAFSSCALRLTQRRTRSSDAVGAHCLWLDLKLKTFLGLSVFKSSQRKAARSSDGGAEPEFCKTWAVLGTVPATVRVARAGLDVT